MKKLGVTLNKVFNSNHKNLRQIDVLKLGVNMIKLIRKFHSVGFVHKDIKCNNLMFGDDSMPYDENSQ
jgi:tRNA A-37 threonylcarbamoyl transferase component Bud32